MTDKDHKEQGNKYFNANKFDSAVESYSKAASCIAVWAVIWSWFRSRSR